jgi:hypothetical protein
LSIVSGRWIAASRARDSGNGSTSCVCQTPLLVLSSYWRLTRRCQCGRPGWMALDASREADSDV